EDTRGVEFRLGHRAGVIKQLAQLVYGVAHVGPQHVLTEELVKHLPDRALQESHPARVPRTVPRIRAVRSVLHELTEKRRSEAVEICPGVANDVSRHKFGGVLEHVNEAVQLAQYVVGDMLRRSRLAIQIDGNVFVTKTQLANEGTQILDGVGDVLGRIDVEFLIVNRQNERTRAALLLGERAEITIAGDTQHLNAFGLDGRRQGAYAKPRRVLGAIVFINDDDGETEFHAVTPWSLLKRTTRAGHCRGSSIAFGARCAARTP